MLKTFITAFDNSEMLDIQVSQVAQKLKAVAYKLFGSRCNFCLGIEQQRLVRTNMFQLLHSSLRQNTLFVHLPFQIILVVVCLSCCCVSSVFDLTCEDGQSDRKGLKYGGIYSVEHITHKDIDSVCNVLHNDVRIFLLRERRKHNNVSREYNVILYFRFTA